MATAASFLKSGGKPAPSHPIHLTLVETSGGQRVATASAVFRFASDRIKSDADADAEKALAALAAKDVPLTDEIRASYQHGHFLHAVVRDREAPASPFFDSAEDAQALLVPSERMRLIAEYQAWVEAQFPDSVSPETFKAMVDDAKVFTVSALLSKYGYWPTRRALASLAMASGVPLTA